jgi:hypothetical protein
MVAIAVGTAVGMAAERMIDGLPRPTRRNIKSVV